MSVAPTELIGTWTLARRVHDRISRRHGRVSGAVEFSAAESGVRWIERGVLIWDGRELDVSRELQVVAAGPGWMVRFSDGRDFHPWRPGQAVTHPCRADVYCGQIDVNPSRSRIRIIWDVSGPAKDQRLYSRLDRVTADITTVLPR